MRSPIDGSVVGRVTEADAATAKKAIDAARSRISGLGRA